MPSNAQGGSYVFRTTGSDNWSGKSAMTEARRREIYGPVKGLHDDARALGEPGPLAVLCWGALILATVTIAIVAFTGA